MTICRFMLVTSYITWMTLVTIWTPPGILKMQHFYRNTSSQRWTKSAKFIRTTLPTICRKSKGPKKKWSRAILYSKFITKTLISTTLRKRTRTTSGLRLSSVISLSANPSNFLGRYQDKKRSSQSCITLCSSKVVLLFPIYNRSSLHEQSYSKQDSKLLQWLFPSRGPLLLSQGN